MSVFIYYDANDIIIPMTKESDKKGLEMPYLRELSEIDGIKIWEVDGTYVREKIESNFSNFAQHYRFKCIPKNEFWIDKERVENETPFFIAHLIVEYDLMSKGVYYEKAVGEAEKIELLMRSKEVYKDGKLIRQIIDHKLDGVPVPKEIYKEKLEQFSSPKLSIWIINGKRVRDLLYVDFTAGGHEFVYKFVPKGEVWIDDDVPASDRNFVLVHELRERKLMSGGQPYDLAHYLALKTEHDCRAGIKDVAKEIETYTQR